MNLFIFTLLAGSIFGQSRQERDLAAQNAILTQEVVHLREQIRMSNAAENRSNVEAVVRKNRNITLTNDKKKLEETTQKQAVEHSTDVATAQDGIDSSVALADQTKTLVEGLTAQFETWKRDLLIIMMSSLCAQLIVALLSFIIMMAGRRAHATKA